MANASPGWRRPGAWVSAYLRAFFAGFRAALLPFFLLFAGFCLPRLSSQTTWGVTRLEAGRDATRSEGATANVAALAARPVEVALKEHR